MSKVLVKAVEAQYPVGAGAPVMVLGGGRGGGSRGRTKREKLLGALGGTVGVLGALTGPHRSLGGLAQSAISGGAQGKQLGSALGRGITRRERQARADLDEKTHGAYAQAAAEGRVPKSHWLVGTDIGVKRERLGRLAQEEAAQKEADWRNRWINREAFRQGYRDDQKATLEVGQAIQNVAGGEAKPLPKVVQAAIERTLTEPGTRDAMLENANSTGVPNIAVTSPRAPGFLDDGDELVEGPDADAARSGLAEQLGYSQSGERDDWPNVNWSPEITEEQRKKLEQSWGPGGTT